MEAAQTSNVSDPAAPTMDARPAAVLKGGARGLDLLIDGQASFDAVEAAITAKLAEAPAFFRGSDVRIRVDAGPLAPGSLTRLDAITTAYDLRIVEVGAVGKRKRDRAASDAIPVAPVQLAAGSAPAAAVEPIAAIAPAPVPVPAPVPAPAVESIVAIDAAASLAPVIEELEADLTPDAPAIRAVVGPIRSGVILEHRGHVVVFGDVNPGAEVRAEGNIIVLGRMRGIAHAGIGRDAGFILALRLEPQQLRISRMVARAADSDAGAREPEIAHITGEHITVERYQGRLPANLATSL